jgi:hypothetical protein
MTLSAIGGEGQSNLRLHGLSVSQCMHCVEFLIWHGDSIVWPPVSTAPKPHGDMPDDAKQDYEEARQVLPHSPRAAAALLRLALQKLCKNLGEPGKMQMRIENGRQGA